MGDLLSLEVSSYLVSKGGGEEKSGSNMVCLVLKCLLSKGREALRGCCELGGLGSASSSSRIEDKPLLWS